MNSLTPTRLAGEQHPLRRLTARQVREIREAKGLQREIAAKYGIRQQQVSRIKNGKRWKETF